MLCLYKVIANRKQFYQFHQATIHTNRGPTFHIEPDVSFRVAPANRPPYPSRAALDRQALSHHHIFLIQGGGGGTVECVGDDGCSMQQRDLSPIPHSANRLKEVGSSRVDSTMSISCCSLLLKPIRILHVRPEALSSNMAACDPVPLVCCYSLRICSRGHWATFFFLVFLSPPERSWGV